MPQKGRPRFGSMGVWPRKRAKNIVPRVRTYRDSDNKKLLAFPVYKAGMTHTIAKGHKKDSRSEGQNTFVPVTILECPPIKIASLRLYKKEGRDLKVKKQINLKVDKEVARKIPKINNKKATDKIEVKEEYDDVTIQVYTQPKKIGLKKKPELFEIKIGGKNTEEKIEFIKTIINKPITIKDVFKEGQIVDVHGVTKGKGFQGPVTRFGIGLKSHKSEKGRRRPGSIGGWIGQHHWQYRVAQAGQLGFHKRTQFNNLVMKISDDPNEVNPKGGFVNYGEVTKDYLMIKGSVPGPKKRMIILTEPMRPNKETGFKSENIKYISTESKQ